LEGEINSPKYRDRTLTLVGHSQGGLIIQSYFARLVAAGAADKLRDVRQAIFLATPSEGSVLANTLREWLFKFFPNTQEETLRVLNEEVAEMRDSIRKNIVGAVRDSKTTWRVPIYAFYGSSDNVVPKASARGVFDNIRAVNGSHTDIHVPENNQDRRYTEFVEVLLDPGGHAHRFEIEEYRNTLRVEEVAPKTIETPGNNPRAITYDNVAKLTRSVKFASANRCADLYKIVYDIGEGGGYLKGQTSRENEIPAEEHARAANNGTFYEFDFSPDDREAFILWLTIYNGFGAQRRNIHFHLDSYQAHMRSLVYELDLSPYLAAGRRLLGDPACRYSRVKATTCEFCQSIRMLDPLPISDRPRDGVYQWRFEEIEGGVVDIAWELAS
ncbi:MAG: lysophospholipase, partial [Verrucomicrobiota bacterium]|nr:lysophospholipase [Verrucomicrobiota bacterium]